MMPPELTYYNLFLTTSLLDLWQLRTLLNDEINQREATTTFFDLLSLEDNKNLLTNVETMLKIEMNGWKKHNPPSLSERKKFIGSLFNYGFPIHTIYSGKHDLLNDALDKENLEMFDYLIHLCNKNEQFNRDCSFLLEHFFNSQNKYKFIRILLNINNPDIIKIYINKKDTDGLTPLMHAVLHHLDMVEHLIITGASLEEVNNQGKTVLLLAATKKNLDIIKLLMKNGANTKATTPIGLNLLLIASDQHHKKQPELLNYLIDNKIDILFNHEDGVPILIHAIQRSFNINTIKLLINQDRVNLPCPTSGNTPLMLAFLIGYGYLYEFDQFNDDLIELLLANDADPSIKNKKNETVFSILKKRYNELAVDDEDANQYNDGIESYVNQLAFKTYENYRAQDATLSDEPENYDTKYKLKTTAYLALKNVENYFKEDYDSAQKKMSMLKLEMAYICLNKYFLGLSTDLDMVVTQFNRVKKADLGNYKKAQFEIASLLIALADTEKDSQQKRNMLICALKHSDEAQEDDVSNQILNSLSGRSITDEKLSMPKDNDQRINALTKLLGDKDKEISLLKQEIEKQAIEIRSLRQHTLNSSSTSSLIRKGSDSSIFSNVNESSSRMIEKDQEPEVPVSKKARVHAT